MIRLSYVCAFALLAACGAAAVARPAWIWVRSQGFLRPALAWDVPSGSLHLAAAALLSAVTLWLALRIALRRRAGLRVHLAFLLAAGLCCGLRHAAGEPRPPPDPAHALLAGLRAAAAVLDAGYAGRYAPDAAAFAPSLARVAPPPFRRLGRPVPLQTRILSAAAGPQLEALEGDRPGTLYVAISSDCQIAWLTALSSDGLLRLPSGRAAAITAHRGTHALPGSDPALPVYPDAR